MAHRQGDWFVWDTAPELFELPDGRVVWGRPGDRIQIGEDDEGNRFVLAHEPKALH